MSAAPEPLAQNPCQDLCEWLPDPLASTLPRRFSCRGCGSQWDRTQGWTPCDRDGTVPAQVRAEVARA
jgi:hypothetical protein